MRSSSFLAAASLVLAAPVFAHHSDAALDMDAVVAFEGTVTEFAWRNPHAYFTVETMDERGEPVEWSIELSAPVVLFRAGWTRSTVKPGDEVTVVARPMRDGRPGAAYVNITLPDGSRLGRVDPTD